MAAPRYGWPLHSLLQPGKNRYCSQGLIFFGGPEPLSKLKDGYEKRWHSHLTPRPKTSIGSLFAILSGWEIWCFFSWLLWLLFYLKPMTTTTLLYTIQIYIYMRVVFKKKMIQNCTVWLEVSLAVWSGYVQACTVNSLFRHYPSKLSFETTCCYNMLVDIALQVHLRLISTKTTFIWPVFFLRQHQGMYLATTPGHPNNLLTTHFPHTETNLNSPEIQPSNTSIPLARLCSIEMSSDTFFHDLGMPGTIEGWYCDPKVAKWKDMERPKQDWTGNFMWWNTYKSTSITNINISLVDERMFVQEFYMCMYKYTTDVAYILQYMLCIDEILIWTLDKNNTKARELPFGVVCSTALFGSTRHCMRLVIQSTVWVWKMWALILAVQLEMRFFQALTVNTVGVLELHWKQLGHIIKPGATDKHQVLWRFFYLGFFWC